MQNNFTFIVMGATGDLAKKKIFPAIYGLLKSGKLGSDFSLVGTARKNLTREEFIESVEKSIPKKEEKIWNKLKGKLYYYSLNFDTEKGFKKFGTFISEIEKIHNTKGNALFYLATLPNHFKNIAKNLDKYCINKSKNCWTKVVFEKPFGDDEKSAKNLNKEIKKVFDEKQIFRIDHYLGKDVLQNIGFLKRLNPNNIDHVQINLIENFGIETRGDFYDTEGALKDVGQSHLLQILSLITMDSPKKAGEKSIRNEKVKVLKSVEKIKEKDIIFGQYKNYTREKGIKKKSKTETFFALKLFINNKKWKNTPFLLRSGKNMEKSFASIYIQFKNQQNTNLNTKPDYLVIQIQPKSGVSEHIKNKIIKKQLGITSLKHSFYKEKKPTEAYETLVYKALEGDQSLFIRAEEIEYAWKILDKINRKKIKMYTYEKNSFGPKESESILGDKRKWFNTIETI